MRRSSGWQPGGRGGRGAIGRALMLLTCATIAVALSGCLSPSYRFVASSDRDVVFRLPRDWKPVDTNAVLKASGVDPATRSGWMVFFDGSSKPSVQHIRANTTTEPVLIAQSFTISATQRSSLTDDELRNAVLPVTQDARTAAAVSAGTTLASSGFTLIKDETLSTKTEHGVHVIFSYKINGTSEFFDQVAVTNPKKTRGQLLVVHCTKQCFDTRSGQIGDIVSSLTLK